MKISVIIATYNQPRFLDLVLHSYEVQNAGLKRADGLCAGFHRAKRSISS